MLINLIRKSKPFSQELEPCAREQLGEAAGTEPVSDPAQRHSWEATASPQPHLPAAGPPSCSEGGDLQAQLQHTSPGSPPLMPLSPVPEGQSSAVATLGSDTALKLPAPHTRGWSPSMNPAGSCTWTAAPKHRELEQPFCLPHRC